ncbi:MAG: UDP-glucose 4-epimerase GalE [Clostridia bacterium]|nr:UDP-glucose 4-epimerase GalE [Clostridia bacterium]
MSVLITGGAGFIGSHTAVEFLNAGYDIVIMDNFSNSKPESLKRIKTITGKDFKFYKADLLDVESMDRIFDENPDIDSVIHFAGLKAVGESVSMPLEYYHNNVTGTLLLCDSMRRHGVKTIVFSSSATVYGTPDEVPIKETARVGNATNPYGETKVMIERILKDIYVSDKKWNISILRYFNPIGAHPTGLMGEDPNGIPNNLMPYITKVAAGKLPILHVFGNDYDTHDGTGVRDYIHVVDLSRAHLAALHYIEKAHGIDYFNVGTGNGYSVLDIVKAYKAATGIDVKYQIDPRRPGDIAECYADPTKAREVLGWTAQYGIEDMCRDANNWQTKNPNGYDC